MYYIIKQTYDIPYLPQTVVLAIAIIFVSSLNASTTSKFAALKIFVSFAQVRGMTLACFGFLGPFSTHLCNTSSLQII